VVHGIVTVCGISAAEDGVFMEDVGGIVEKLFH
jgi:hypothetical protein